jgi:hypothetical protein
MCLFCDCASHLDEFCFRHKRIDKRRFDFARNSYRNKFTDFPLHSYSRAPPRTPSHAMSRLLQVANHRSYGSGSRENSFVPRRFGYDPRHHRGDRFPRRQGFLARGSYTHFEPRHLDSPCFPYRGPRPTGSKVEVQKTMKTSLGRVVKC